MSLYEEMKRIDAELANRYLPNATGEPEDEFQAVLWLTTDIEIIMLQQGVQVYDEILSVIQTSDCAEQILKEYCNVEKIREMVMIRTDFKSALSEAKDGHEIARRLMWTLFKEDFCKLAKIHKAGEFRGKIENLLLDCGFEQVSAELAQNHYDCFLGNPVAEDSFDISQTV